MDYSKLLYTAYGFGQLDEADVELRRAIRDGLLRDLQSNLSDIQLWDRAHTVLRRYGHKLTFHSQNVLFYSNATRRHLAVYPPREPTYGSPTVEHHDYEVTRVITKYSRIVFSRVGEHDYLSWPLGTILRTSSGLTVGYEEA